MDKAANSEEPKINTVPFVRKKANIFEKIRRFIFLKADPNLPGPRGLPFLGVSLAMIKESIPLITQIFEQHGDTASLPLPGMMGVQTCDPDLIQKALLQTEKHFLKGRIYKRLASLFGDGLVSSQGEIWKLHRHYMDPFFTQRSVMLYMKLIEERSKILVNNWKSKANQVVNISKDAMDLTFEVLLESLFSKDLNKFECEKIKDDLEVLHEYSRYIMYTALVLPKWLPTRRHRALNKATRNLNTLIAKEIEKRQSSSWKAQGKDIISLLLDLKDAEGKRALSDKQIRDHVITMYLAGHDTTAHTLSFTLYLLASHSDILQKLRQHIKNVLENGEITTKALKKMDYLEKVINESMRLYPTAWSINRTSCQDIYYKDYFFPAGTTFFLPQYLVHRHPAHWKEPKSFRPEHFDEEEVHSRHKFAFFPFGGGPRNCIGYHLAMMELKIALIHIVQNFNFSSSEIQKMQVKARITLSPDPDLFLKPITLEN